LWRWLLARDSSFRDMRAEVADERYCYPDLAIVCAPVAELDVIAPGPCVVEVTSPTTGRIDRWSSST
jgi:hypothetical protein